MAVVMKPGANEEDIKRVVRFVRERYGLRVDVSRGEFQTVIGLIGNEDRVDFEQLAALPGVERAYRITSPYRLVSRNFFPENRVIEVKGVKIGEGNVPVFIAGPCAIESREQIFRIAREVHEAGANILRGGAFKPRTSVHSFQGLGEKGLEYLAGAGEEYGMPTVSEVRSEKHVELVAKYVDILQIGARNMYNQDLIEEAAKQKKPILLKRNFGASIEEFLSFAERAAAQGNKDIILCERGVLPIGRGRQFTRYSLDLSAVPVIRKETYLPIIVDPSHGTGRRDLIYSMSKAAIAAGAHGLMIEAHYNPDEALSDGPQMITPKELKRIIDVCKRIYAVNVMEDNMP
ncbi:MAG: 3-deoxy-7-phosphoheptulonate synthase [Candidatus Bathyarchaeia archaeon]